VLIYFVVTDCGYCCLRIRYLFIPNLLRYCVIVTLSKFITYYIVMYMIYNRDGSLKVNLNLIFEIEEIVPQWSTLPEFIKK
jgi:hypothetical protein